MINEVIKYLEKNRLQPNIQLMSIEYIKNKAKEINAIEYLEIGLFNGYSALQMSLVCNVTSIEIDKKNIEMAKENIKEANVKNINIIKGDAIEKLTELAKIKKTFDIILIDAKKSEYKKYLELSLKVIKKGFIYADNTISHKENMKDFFVYLEENKLKWKELEIGRGVVEIKI